MVVGACRDSPVGLSDASSSVIFWRLTCRAFGRAPRKIWSRKALPIFRGRRPGGWIAWKRALFGRERPKSRRAAPFPAAEPHETASRVAGDSAPLFGARRRLHAKEVAGAAGRDCSPWRGLLSPVSFHGRARENTRRQGTHRVLRAFGSSSGSPPHDPARSLALWSVWSRAAATGFRSSLQAS